MLSRSFFFSFFLEPMTPPPSTPDTTQTRTTASVVELEGGFTSFSSSFGPSVCRGWAEGPEGFWTSPLDRVQLLDKGRGCGLG